MRPTVVQMRPDTVVAEFNLDASRWDAAVHAAEGAAHGGWAPWEGMAVSYGRRRGALAFQTPLMRGLARRGSIEVTAGAVACASFKPDECFAQMQSVADAWGRTSAVTLRRIDIAADVAGWDVNDIRAEGIVINARVAARLDEWRRGRVLTGFTVAPGNGIKCNLYDKLRELRRPESEHKAEMEMAAWRAGGWDGAAPVTRVEAQMRTTVARQLGFELPNLAPAIDPAWQYVTRKWMRVVDLSTATRRERAKPVAAWTACQRATYERHAPPAARVRAKSGPSARSTLGVVRAMLASRGELPEDASPESYASAAADLIQRELGAQMTPGQTLAYLSERDEVARKVYGQN